MTLDADDAEGLRNLLAEVEHVNIQPQSPTIGMARPLDEHPHLLMYAA
jgi:hypothetical protein